MDDKEKQLIDFFAKILLISEKCKRKEPFNAFLSFGVNSQEVMHSKFIAMLLNPKGVHKHADKFLKLFLNQLQIDGFDYNGATVKCEKIANGRRRIDIAIWNHTQFLVIENKLGANDRDNQLRDYYNFALAEKKSDENVFVIYLTKYGISPSNNSLEEGDLLEGYKKLSKEKVICISYEKHIIKWLKSCIDSLSVDSQDIRLKISLEMYVELVRNVIKRDEYMNEIMSNLMSNPENMELAIDIIKSFQGKSFLKDKYFGKLIVDQIKKVAGVYFGDDVEEPEGDLSNLWNRDWYQLEMKDNQNSIDIILTFNESEIDVTKNGKSINELQIRCNDLNNQYLIYLLTQNEQGVNDWMRKIYEFE